MNCRRLRSVLFDYQDGSLSSDQREKVEKHLAACSSCRKELAAEAGIASKMRTCFEKRQRAFPFRAEALSSSLNELPRDRRAPGDRRNRFMKALVPISLGAALVIAALLIFRPARLPFAEVAPQASRRAGDLPDPFRDWIEKRMIITIEDKNAGTIERIEADTHGIIARSVETRGNR
jgi:anti-sigma factor RsiW